jgi:hypothetical protein
VGGEDALIGEPDLFSCLCSLTHDGTARNQRPCPPSRAALGTLDGQDPYKSSPDVYRGLPAWFRRHRVGVAGWAGTRWRLE